VKLLFDQNLSPRLVEALADLFDGSALRIVSMRRGNCSTQDIEALLRKHTVRIAALGSDPDTRFLVLF
jgi:predicted nuclease of predicted toxin-antitoxin system